MRSYSSRDLMWARSRKCSGHSNLRCSCSTESMLISAVGTEVFSDMVRLVSSFHVKGGIEQREILPRAGPICLRGRPGGQWAFAKGTTTLTPSWKGYWPRVLAGGFCPGLIPNTHTVRLLEQQT